jgi:uncharacterized protein
MPVYCFFLQGFFDTFPLCPYDCAPMPEPRLPVSVELTKMTSREVEMQGEIALADLPRLENVLSDVSGKAQVSVRFSVDDQKRQCIAGNVSAKLSIFCQRCLEPMDFPVAAEFNLAAVRDEAQAAQLPREMDPVIVQEEVLNLHELIEEELLLSLPYVSYHEERCAEAVNDPVEVPVADTQRPFEGLAALLKDQ